MLTLIKENYPLRIRTGKLIAASVNIHKAPGYGNNVLPGHLPGGRQVALISIYAFSRIGVDLLPNVNIPHMLVQTTYPDATPEEVEKLITEPLESAVGTNALLSCICIE